MQSIPLQSRMSKASGHLQHAHVYLVQVAQPALIQEDHQHAKSLRLVGEPGQQQRRHEVHALAVVYFRVVCCICAQQPLKLLLALLFGKPDVGRALGMGLAYAVCAGGRLRMHKPLRETCVDCRGP